MQLDACSRETSYTCNGNFVSKYIETAVTRTVMAALVWAGFRRVPLWKFEIRAHVLELTGIGFELPQGALRGKKVIRG